MAALALLSGCDSGKPTEVAGGGIETETITLSGAINRPGDAGAAAGPALGARVSVRSVEFLQGPRTVPAPTTRDTLTGAAGAYAIAGLPAREYAVEISLGDTLGLFRRTVPEAGKNARVEGLLTPMGHVSGKLSPVDAGAVFFVQAYGVARRVPLSADGRFDLALAEGEYVVRLASESSRYTAVEIPRVAVTAGNATVLPDIDLNALLPKSPVSVLFENNLADGMDDAAAVAVLHALADNGELRLLGMVTNSTSDWSGPALDAINTYYGRPDLPVGVSKDSSSRTPGTLYPPDHYPYDEYIAMHWPHNAGAKADMPEATALYRGILTAQPDSSVVIISVGALNNLYALMLADRDLVSRKVKELVIQGGVYPSGADINFKSGLGGGGYPNTTVGIVTQWPTPITFIGSEAGTDLAMGSCLEETATDNPIRKAAELTLGNAGKTHASLDVLPVLYAARGLGKYFTAVTAGSNLIHADGSNAWVAAPDKDQAYLVRKMPATGLTAELDKLMCQPPRR